MLPWFDRVQDAGLLPLPLEVARSLGGDLRLSPLDHLLLSL